MRTDFVEHTLREINLRLTEMSRSHKEEETVALQRDILRSLDACLYHLENQPSSHKYFPCANSYSLVKQIDQGLIEDMNLYDQNSDIYELQRSSILRKVQRIKKRIFPVKLPFAA